MKSCPKKNERGKWSGIVGKSRFWLLCVILAGLIGSPACSEINEHNTLYPEKNRGELLLLETCPRNGASDAALTTVVRMLFNKDLDPKTVNGGTLLLGTGRWHVKGDIFYDDRVVTYVPTVPLDPKFQYNMFITAGLLDEDGLAATDDLIVFTFTTGDPGLLTCRW